MIIWMPKFYKWAFVVFWYTPTPWWKLWRGYPLSIAGNLYPTLYAGPLKIVSGPRY